MLSFTEGKPIAIIKGGKYKNEILHIKDQIFKNDNENQTNEYFKKGKREEIPYDEMEIIEEIISKKLKSKKDTLNKKKLINKIMKNKTLKEKYTKNKIGKEIKLDNGYMQPIPNTKTRDVIYVCAPSGSGKSTYISNYAKEYKKIFPNNKIYVFSRLTEDKPIDELKAIRIEINNALVLNPILPEELENSLVIFDDIDTLRDKRQKDAIMALKDDLLQVGRHMTISLLITSHLMTNYKETRIVLNEAQQIVIFPHSGSDNSIKYVLKAYVGLDKDDINKILKLGSRWVTVYKTAPQAILYSYGAYII